jgi:hypothetical protein
MIADDANWRGQVNKFARIRAETAESQQRMAVCQRVARTACQPSDAEQDRAILMFVRQSE